MNILCRCGTTIESNKKKSVKMKYNKYTAIDFFCGGGGMTCVFAKQELMLLQELILIKRQNILMRLIIQEVFCRSNIRELEEEYFEKRLSVQRNDDNLILVGCSPCQFYSIINTSREKSKASKDLLLEFQRFIKYYNPGYVLVENVPGIITNKYSVLPEFLSFLKDYGYIYIKKDIIDMSYYGVPQSRRRFSLIASRVRTVSLPVKEKKQAILADYIGVWNGFAKISAGYKDSTDLNHTTAGLSDINLRRLAKPRKTEVIAWIGKTILHYS